MKIWKIVRTIEETYEVVADTPEDAMEKCGVDGDPNSVRILDEEITEEEEAP